MHIHIALTPQCLASSFTLPLEMLVAAHEIARSRRIISVKQTLRISYVAENRESLQSNAGISFTPDLSAAEAVQKPAPNLILVPSLWRKPIHLSQAQAQLSRYLQYFSDLQVLIGTAGTGSSLLTPNGYLDNRAATTHWFYFDEMEKHFPNVQWMRSYRITQSRNIFCAGSVNSIADLCVHLIEKLYNAETAQQVANQFSPEARQPLQEQLFNEQTQSGHLDEQVAQTQDDIRRDLAQTLNAQQLAEKSGLSLRSLQRRFKAATGLTMLAYQQTLRIDSAKALLRDTNANIEEIAQLNGYADTSHFARYFKRATQLTPNQYRDNVRRKLFEPTEDKL